MKITLSKNNDNFFINFITLYFFCESVNIFVDNYLGGFPYFDFLAKGILFVSLFVALMVVTIRSAIFTQFIIVEALIVLLLIITCLKGTSGAGFLKNSIYILGIYVPIGVCTSAIQNKRRLLNSLYTIHIFPQILLILTMICFNDGIFNYNMSASYALLLWTLIAIDHYFYEKRIVYDVIIVLIDVAIILLKGARGPLVCVFAYIIMEMLFDNLELTRKKAMIITIITMGVFAFWGMYYTGVFKTFYSFLLNHGMQSRVLWTLSNDILYSSGRDTIYNRYLELISNKPLTGYGLLGGRCDELAQPHNSVLETIFYFGIPGGLIFLVWYVIKIIKVFLKNRQRDTSRLLLIIIATLISTLISNELFLTPYFYMGLAIIVGTERDAGPVHDTIGMIN